MRNQKNLKMDIVVALGVLLTVFSVLFTNVTAYACTEAELIALVNSERVSAGLSPLKIDEELSRAAKVRAQECASKFSHTRPDGSDFYTVSDAVYGENLANAEEYHTSEDVVRAWMQSPKHKENILYAKSTKTGLSVYEVNGKAYIAEEFD